MVMEPLCQWWGSPDNIRAGRCLLEQPAGCCPHGDRKTCGVSLFCSTEKPRFGFGRWVSCAEFGFHRGWTQSCSSSSHETHRALEQRVTEIVPSALAAELMERQSSPGAAPERCSHIVTPSSLHRGVSAAPILSRKQLREFEDSECAESALSVCLEADHSPLDQVKTKKM